MARAKKKFDICHEDMSNVKRLAKKRFTKHDLIGVEPLNERQNQLWQMYYENTPLIVQRGYAGVGKTFSALYLAFTQVLDYSTHYDQVIIVRSAVETRGQGFLPGELEDKEEPYKTPYRAAVDELFHYNQPYDNLEALGYLKFMTTSYLRGVNINNAIIIVDEINNMDYKEISTVITRCGKNSRIILMGDEAQEDLSRIRQQTGMPRLLNVLKNMPYDMVGIVDYKPEDIVRSGLVQEFVMADLNTPY